MALRKTVRCQFTVLVLFLLILVAGFPLFPSPRALFSITTDGIANQQFITKLNHLWADIDEYLQ